MKHRSPDRPRRADGDSPFADRILTPRDIRMGDPEGRSDIAGIGHASLAVARQAASLTGVAPPEGWTPIQSP
jgi:hypothetical protein